MYLLTIVFADPSDETIHVVTCSPVGVFHMPRKDHNTIIYSDLYNIFPGLVRKSVKAAALGSELNGHIVIHEEVVSVETEIYRQLNHTIFLQHTDAHATKQFSTCLVDFLMYNLTVISQSNISARKF